MFQEKIDTIKQKLAAVEREMDELNSEIMKKPSRHGQPWTTFESETATGRFNGMVDSLALQFGRTKLSIILFIDRYISRGCSDARTRTNKSTEEQR